MRRFVSVVVISTILAFSVLATTPDAFGKGQSLPTVMSKQHGYALQQSREGMPVLISKTFLNTGDTAQSITVIFDIRKDDVGIYLAWEDVTALPRSGTDTSVSWTPPTAGKYQIRAFVVSNMTEPEVLEDVAESRLTVVSEEYVMAKYSDRPTSFSITPANPVPLSQTTPLASFNEKQNLGSGFNSGIGEIATSDNGLYVVGVSELPPLGESPPFDIMNQLVYFLTSNDGGLTFRPMRYLINNTHDLTFAGRPSVHAVNDTFLYVTWLQQDYDKDNFELLVSKSFNGGATFSSTVSLDYEGVGFGDLDTQVSVDGKSLYILSTEVYQYAEPWHTALLFRKSLDYAESFTPRQIILNHTGSEYVSCAQITVQESDSNSDNKIYVTWREDSEEKYMTGDKNMELLFAASYDNGATFSEPVVIREAYTGDYDCPTVAIDRNDVYLFWAETKLIYRPEDPSEILVGDTDIFFAASRDSGRTFESPVNLSEGIGAFTMESEMLVSEGRIYAVWRDTIPEVGEDGFLSFYGNSEVIMTRSLDGGRTFERSVNLSNNPSGSYEPEIAVHGDDVYVIWMESTFPSNQAGVSLRISTDGGKTFGGIAENIVGLIPEPVSRPRVLTSPDGEQIYILWSQMPADEYTVHMYALTGVPLDQKYL